VNTLEAPMNVAPVISTLSITGEQFEVTLPPFTQQVLRMPF